MQAAVVVSVQIVLYKVGTSHFYTNLYYFGQFWF
jgi:hypothetical protein